jgi:hypothetical protein
MKMTVQSNDKILGYTKMRKQFDILEGPGDPQSAYLMGLEHEQIISQKRYPSAFWDIHPRDTIKHGGLSCPIWPDQTKDLALKNIKRNTIQSTNTTKTHGNGFNGQETFFTHLFSQLEE